MKKGFYFMLMQFRQFGSLKINVKKLGIDLLSMSEERVSITTKIGRIIIKGKDLAVKKLLNKEILIKGYITNIEMGDNNV